MGYAEIVKRVAEAQPLNNEDQEFWWQATGKTFGILLEKSGYTPEQIQHHLTWYREQIPASLGPRPVPGKKFPFTTGPIRDGSNVEFSINWKEKSKGKRRIRFTVGAVDDKAGTEADRFGQKETGRLLERMKQKYIPDLSTKRFEIFNDHFFIKKEDEAAALAKIPSDIPRVQIWVAFDIQPDLNAKVYYVPFNKTLETGKHSNTLFFEAAADSSRDGLDFSPGVNTLKAYIDSKEHDYKPVSHLISLDCAEGPDARIKAYVSSMARSLKDSIDLWTLGGRVTGPEVDEGIKALTQFWPIFFGIDPNTPDLENLQLFPEWLGMQTSIEIKSDSAIPDLKLQFPTDAIEGGITDGKLADRLADYFRIRGDPEYADTFKADMQESLYVFCPFFALEKLNI